MKAKNYSYVLLFVALVLYIGVTCFFMPFPADFEDSYIMHRYAQNGVDGFPFQWNEHSSTVQGMTGIAWVSLITLLARFTRFNVVSVNSYAGLIFSIFALLFVYFAAVRNSQTRNHWAALLVLPPLISSAFFIRSSANGLETSIVVFMIALSIYLLKFRKATWGESIGLGIFAGLTTLIRPDLPIFPASLFLFALAFADFSKKQRLGAALALLASALISALLALLLARTLTGTALPLAASYKLALRDMLTGHFPISQFNYIFGAQFDFFSHVTPLVVLAGLSTVLLGYENSKRYLTIYGACAVYFAYLFTVLPIMDVAYRYQLPLLIGLSFAVMHFFDFIKTLEIPEKRRYTLLVGIVFALILGNVSLLFAGRKEAMMFKTDHGDFAQIGSELEKIDGISVASPEAGKLAAYSRHKFLDTVGLNDAFVAKNKNRPDYPALLSNYLHTDFGIPDVYVRKAHTLDDRYTFLEILPDFKELYVCNNVENSERLQKVVCVYKSSPHAKKIVSSLAPSGVEVALP